MKELYEFNTGIRFLLSVKSMCLLNGVEPIWRNMNKLCECSQLELGVLLAMSGFVIDDDCRWVVL